MKPLQRGFSLLEVLVAIALTSGVLLAVTAAVLNALHTTALAEERSALADDALNALVDLRSATGYDANLLAALANHTSQTTIPKSASVTETLTISIGGRNGTQPLVATATASDGTQTVTEHRDLYWEAPAPGSVVQQ
ncbi:MAG: prepilin-type N-terminal cleavage/methylation domain-containing protein [Candidatus Eremiobacteraeota bacterium]|nr:prepilin-type N-terminal cleavage/methylation domain-containing protein [Candidatus Eremiobacteraeota bacterium]MBC5801882.1 prepilin-type N-terminal cleavage/methylation domain-containing protein [Candidatus Eremiobacteraeota bacterium]MBC5822241.1 prepilin-type N-terminal cleavage/methylation domain-containing protein [Candidatus Eremiobacteraeota bacterium]